VRQLEIRALQSIRYHIIVTPSSYAEYFFELRNVFAEITGIALVCEDSVQHRLSTAQAMKIKVYSKSLKSKGKKDDMNRKKKDMKRIRKNIEEHPSGSRALKTNYGNNTSSDTVMASSSELNSSHRGNTKDDKHPNRLFEDDDSFYDYQENNLDDSGDVSTETANSMASTIPWSPKGSALSPGEPHGRAEHCIQRVLATLEQGSNTYEDITRTMNIGALVLS
jgi:hypothetical protein